MTDNLYRRALTALLDAAEARDFDPPVPTELVAALEHAAQEEADLKAQRDELAGLLRDLADVADEKAWTAYALAGLLEEWLPKARAALAKLD